MSFFCISGSQDDNGKFSFRSTRNTLLTKAVGTKSEKLNSDAELHNLQVEDTVAFELQAAKAARDWSIEPAKETQCKLLATFARTATGVPELDDVETIWQCNWVQTTEPSQGQSIKNNDGTRLWLPLTFADDSGTIVLYITEQAVLKLANVIDAPEFEQLHSEGRLRFPFWASVKVWRKRSKPSEGENFDCYIVDAAAQDIHNASSMHSTKLLPMLSNSVDNVLPTTLGMIRKSDHYALAVQYITQEVPPELTKVASKAIAGEPLLRPCSKAIALVLSTKRSKAQDVGASGHKLVTDGVVDLLPGGKASVQNKYSLTSFCTLDTITEFSSWIHHQGPRTKLH